MIGYVYDGNTKKYIGTTYLQKDPLESKKQGRDVLLIPANVTLVEPTGDLPEGHHFEFDGTEWNMVEAVVETPEPETPEEPIYENRDEDYNPLFEELVLDETPETIEGVIVTWRRAQDLPTETIKANLLQDARSKFVQFCRSNTDDYILEATAEGTPIPEEVLTLRASKKLLYETYKTDCNACETTVSLKELGALTL